ncbi:MAG: right-handed parallel beta-helix repeat-containing protein [Bacteroidota bacterium]
MLTKDVISYSSLFLLLFFLGTSSPGYTQTPIDELGVGGDIFIDEPGHYFLRDTLWVNRAYRDGITIRSDNVTLDLNGFAIMAGPLATRDGIEIDANNNNITIKNGVIAGFGKDGINAFSADMSTFQNLHLRDNGGEGLRVDFSCLIVDCTATGNGSFGFLTDDCSIIRNCTASNNALDGIRTGDGCIIDHCTSFNNGEEGINPSPGSKVEGSITYDNATHGLRIEYASMCINNTSYRNGWNGIEINDNALIMYNVSNDNGQCIANGTCGSGTNGQGVRTSHGAGIRTFANSRVAFNQCDGNYFGLVGAAADASFISNSAQHNRHAGIIGTGSGSLYLKNTAEGNGFAQSPTTSDITTYPLGNIVFSINIVNEISVGPIIDISNAGDISTLSGASHPFANFSY